MVQRKPVVTVVVTLAVAFGVALVLNWAILGFFGQESADRAEHNLVGILLLLGYMAAGAGSPTNIGQAVGIFSRPLCRTTWARFPDLDIRLLGISGHRNPLFHSGVSLSWSCRSDGRCDSCISWLPGMESVWQAICGGTSSTMATSGGYRVGTIDRLRLGVHGLLCLMTPSSRSLRGGGPE